jgi:hypothetical protein
MAVQANNPANTETNLKGEKKRKEQMGTGTSRHVSLVSFDLVTYNTAIFPIERGNDPGTITTPAIKP